MMKSSEKVGVKGMLPLGCLPLWGRVGVTFVFFNQQKDEQNQVFSPVKRSIKK